MFKSLIVKYITDFVAKAIIAAGTVAISKGYGTTEVIVGLENNLIAATTVIIAIAATTGIKALNDNKVK